MAPFALSTGEVLDAIRDVIGDTLTIGTHTLTWQKKVEGSPLRWLSELTDYPVIILQPADTDNRDSPSLLDLELPVDLYVVIQATNAGSSGIAAGTYKTIRLVGEGVVGKLMDAGPQLGTTWLQRTFSSGGVEYDLTEAYADHGLLIYRTRFTFRYFENEVSPP